MSYTQAIPWSFVVLRALGGPAIVLGAHAGWTGAWLSVMVVAALLSDVYDGVLARRWGCETASLRMLDSIADTVFHMGVTGTLWVREPEVLRGSWRLFAVLLGLEASRYAFDLVKFGKAASYHSYLAKAWGLVIVVAVVGSLNAVSLRRLIPVAVVFGVAVNLEGLAMSAILPRWTHDVKTLARAWALRREMLRDHCE